MVSLTEDPNKTKFEIKVDGKVVAWAIIKDGVLDFIGVEVSHRRRGYARKLLVQIMDWMKKTNNRILYFVCANTDFWAKMQAEFPKNIFLKDINGYCRIIAR